ncbi:hypothetical protein BLNAU_12019 [Blattamonas nauphoetae]|uniref:Uncharacterized protein n=1 Tax=Blattamonas nauphoetae TaxID=2049346 RepID=A0ABQ9XNF2_9EUKA|nr:hypothetical protein BLNAU_12019 [Blattamonas nauphoetae]
MDCSAFLNWSKEQPQSDEEMAVIFLSLVATVKLQPVLNAPLETKAVRLMQTVRPKDFNSADAFLSNFPSSSDEYLTDFVQSLVVLISSPSQIVTTAAMKMLKTLIIWCSAEVRFPLVRADLIPQLINTLNPHSLSFSKAVDIHINLSIIIHKSLWLATPKGLTQLASEDRDEPQAVHETIFKQVVVPSETYIWHLCVNRNSIIEKEQSKNFLLLLAQLLHISPSYQSTMEFALHMPVILTIPSYLTFFELDDSIYWFLYDMNDTQWEWNEQGGEERQMWNTVVRLLRMEGFEDVMEAKLQNDQNEWSASRIVNESIRWNKRQGMNLR